MYDTSRTAQNLLFFMANALSRACPVHIGAPDLKGGDLRFLSGSGLGRPVSEHPAGQGEGNGCDTCHGPDLGPDCREIRAGKKYLPEAIDHIAQGVGVGCDLKPPWHIFDGGGEAPQDDGRHDDDKGAQQCLLHCC